MTLCVWDVADEMFRIDEFAVKAVMGLCLAWRVKLPWWFSLHMLASPSCFGEILQWVAIECC